MKLNFLSKNLPAFGLSLRGGSFKLVQLEKKAKGLYLKASNDTPLPKGMVVNDVITDPKTFDYLLKQALQKPQFGKIDTNYVVASLPESKSFVRVIQIPRMSESEAENAVPFEAESFIPLPIDQVYLDWQKIGESGDKMSILMVASPKEFVDKYLEILDKTGLKTVGLEVESQSCHRAVMAAQSQDTVLLVDISSSRTSLMMVEAGNLEFTSTIPIAGNSFTDCIAKALGVSSAKAEEVKRKVGMSNTAEYPNIKTSVLPVLNSLSEEIKNILRFHNEHSQNQVSKVVLFGGGAALKNLPEYLGQELSASGVSKTELANPWQNLVNPGEGLAAGIEHLALVSAIGLAIRGVDFQISQ